MCSTRLGLSTIQSGWCFNINWKQTQLLPTSVITSSRVYQELSYPAPKTYSNLRIERINEGWNRNRKLAQSTISSNTSHKNRLYLWNKNLLKESTLAHPQKTRCFNNIWLKLKKRVFEVGSWKRVFESWNGVEVWISLEKIVGSSVSKNQYFTWNAPQVSFFQHVTGIWNIKVQYLQIMK